MDEKKRNFIKTTDPETAQLLRESGFTELTENNTKTFCFINDGKLLFETNKGNCIYTNVLHL